MGHTRPMFLAPTPTLSGSVLRYSEGIRGVRETLAVMRAMVNEYRVNPRMRQAATCAIFLSPEKNDMHEIETLFNLVRDNVRYVRDICDVETLSTPDKTLEGLIGDCDDQTTLLCTLLESVGYKTRFVVAAYSAPNHYEHVYAQVFVPVFGDWINIDPTEREPIGYAPPNPFSLLIEKV